MDKNNVIRSFSIQAKQFSQNKVLSNQEQLDAIVLDAGIKESEWVLDLGCGTGFLTKSIRKKTTHVVGIDLTREMLEEAVKENQSPTIMYTNGDGEKLPFFDKQFDVVMTRLTMHHFEQPEIILKEIHRVVKDNGRVVIADIIASDDAVKQARHNEVERKRDPSHVKFFNELELKKLLEQNGFRVEASRKWVVKRKAAEWLGIMGEMAGKNEVIRLLENGIENDSLGIQVLKEEGDVTFNHHWISFTASKWE